MYKEWKYKEMVTMQAGGLFLTRHSGTLCRAMGDYTELTTDYVGDMIYENGELKEILTPEGYWQNGVYYYYLRDHLGNTRVVVNGSGAIVEKSHYYPSGMRFQESTSNSAALPYRYGGKELEAVNGLNQYDFGARRRTAGVPIWTTPDRKAEDYYGVSPYVYCANNPMKFVDPNGTTIHFYMENREHNNPFFELADFSKLKPEIQEWFFGWASSKSGQNFLSNFVDGEQSLSWKGSTVTIKGNGNNYDADYDFGSAIKRYDPRGSLEYITGFTEWEAKDDKPKMTIHLDIHQSVAEQIVDFGHEQAVHAEGNVDYLNKNYNKEKSNLLQIITKLNSGGHEDHVEFDNQSSSTYKNMMLFIYGMNGWMGTSSMNEELLKAFENNYQNNKENVKRGE